MDKEKVNKIINNVFRLGNYMYYAALKYKEEMYTHVFNTINNTTSIIESLFTEDEWLNLTAENCIDLHFGSFLNSNDKDMYYIIPSYLDCIIPDNLELLDYIKYTTNKVKVYKTVKEAREEYNELYGQPNAYHNTYVLDLSHKVIRKEDKNDSG